VVKKVELPLKKYIVFDLAMPRDVEEKVSEMENVELYNIDSISMIHDENHIKRTELMNKNKTIIDKYLQKYEEYTKTKDLLPHIHNLIRAGNTVFNERYESYKNKRSTRDEKELAELLLKSTSDFYVNSAIEVLKEEHIKGKGQECLNILNRIFRI
jgi:glutamyl-tRNA reductase